MEALIMLYLWLHSHQNWGVLSCWIGDFSQHEYGIRVSLHECKEEWPVECQCLDKPCLVIFLENLRTFLCHLEHIIVKYL